MPAYYNEFEPFAAEWLKNLIDAGYIAPGDVDTRSITEVKPDDVNGYDQCHFFAGIGGWSLAARLAGWPDNKQLWTGSCPCQPYSLVGDQKGKEDKRHLWPVWFSLIGECCPSKIAGEQVAAAIGQDWLDGVCADLERKGYTCGTTVLPACAVNSPHKRDRSWFVASETRQMGNTNCAGLEGYPGNVINRRGWKEKDGHVTAPDIGNPWDHSEWLTGWDDQERRIKPGIQLLADGLSGNVACIEAGGNAIVPQVAAEVLTAFMEVCP